MPFLCENCRTIDSTTTHIIPHHTRRAERKLPRKFPRNKNPRDAFKAVAYRIAAHDLRSQLFRWENGQPTRLPTMDVAAHYRMTGLRTIQKDVCKHFPRARESM